MTREDVEAARGAGALELETDDVVTQAARELAARTGVTLARKHAQVPAVPAAPAGSQPTPTAQRTTCVVTAVGRNRPFILAEITTRIGELEGDVLDISQRIVGDYFSTILIVDLKRVAAFGAFKGDLEGLGKPGDYKVIVQHERIFKAMHRL